MKHIKHWLATMAMLLCSVMASAHDFEVGGICYSITSSSDLTVAVTYRGNSYSQYSNEYSGAITIPSIVTYNGKTYSVTSIGKSAFYYCSSLTSITIPENSQLTSIGSSAFCYCSNLTSITLPESVTSIGNYAFRDCSSLTSITLPEGVTSIGDYAFYGCSNLTSITIPESVTSIGIYAFFGCSSLTSITLPENVTSIGDYAFYDCSSLTSITLPESVTSIGDFAFDECSRLTSIIIPEGVTSFGGGAFSGCRSLTAIVVAEGNKVYDSRNGCNAIIETNSNTLIQGCATTIIPESVTSIGENAFSGCISLTSITLPEGVTSIGDFAFSDCNSLTSITLPEGVTSIGISAFAGSSLTTITIPENSQLTSIGIYAFFGCPSLTSITLPEGVTSIGDYAFSGCIRLTSITIPESVTSIGGYAFNGCSKLIDVYCYAETVPSTSVNAFNGSYPENATLHIPASTVENYRNIEPWSSFGTFVSMAIETAPENITLTIGQYGSCTYCSPYALDFSEVEGLKAYAATGYDSETGVVTLTRVMTAKAGMGLFVKGEPGDYVVPILESTSFNTLNMLVGTLEDVIVNGTDGLYTNYKYAAPDGEPLFYQFADGSTQKAGRAYLQIPTSWLTTATAKSISYRFDDGETTDIENSEITTPNSEFIYDLYGRRVENPVKGGVYIVKGKKIVY